MFKKHAIFTAEKESHRILTGEMTIFIIFLVFHSRRRSTEFDQLSLF